MLTAWILEHRNAYKVQRGTAEIPDPQEGSLQKGQFSKTLEESACAKGGSPKDTASPPTADFRRISPRFLD